MIIMKKVLIFILALALLLIIGFLTFYNQQGSQSSSIFDEIYKDEIQYAGSGDKSQMKLLKIKGADLVAEKDSSDFQAGTVMVIYKSKDFPENSNLNIIANKKQMLSFDYEEKWDENVQLSLTASYDAKAKTLTQKAKLLDYDSKDVIVPRDKFESYGLTQAKIEEKFALFEKVFLKEWEKVSSGRFSLSDKGNVKVVKKWK
ncbi:TipC family immunity protein [Streptococcus sanguinis]|uniref:TipC family immunity protein n=1 Tax=Streptococcus sanguinis TaxID=1305 RepID=UPI001CBB1415|nr:TipC family immunity protein [Streptococcus sanguinis]MBZ2037568.1 TipC family immunity protein [Streptococcus sanguinis]MBZ2067767.1 TipC family immunity protein [Streptococcus sanguinis]MBZ2070116.1 TipC family immunity protein [Streptococcus sanguinis]